MAHIDHSFGMPGEPAAAQELFLRQLGPDLAKDGSFQLVHEQAGELVFNDALNGDELATGDLAAPAGGAGSGDEDQLTDLAAPAEQTFPPASSVQLGAGQVVNLGDVVLSRHLHVEFAAGAGGTEVRIHGHVRRHLRAALLQLGTPQHWPETSDLPHD